MKEYTQSANRYSNGRLFFGRCIRHLLFNRASFEPYWGTSSRRAHQCAYISTKTLVVLPSSGTEVHRIPLRSFAVKETRENMPLWSAPPLPLVEANKFLAKFLPKLRFAPTLTAWPLLGLPRGRREIVLRRDAPSRAKEKQNETRVIN